MSHAPIHDGSSKADLLSARADAVDAHLAAPTAVTRAVLSAIDSILTARGIRPVYVRSS